MFCTTQITLDKYLPEAKTNFDVWLHYFIIKDAAYDTMLFFMALVTFLNVHRIAKAVACYALMVTGGSFIDKVIFSINQYLYSDVILIGLSLVISVYLYFKKWKTLKHGL